METAPAGVDPALALTLAVLAFLGTVIGPVLVAFISRGGKANSPEPPDLDIIAEQDEDIARLSRENQRLHEQNMQLIRDNERLRITGRSEAGDSD